MPIHPEQFRTSTSQTLDYTKSQQANLSKYYYYLTLLAKFEPKKAKRTRFPSVPRPVLDLMSWHQLPICTHVLPVASEVCACQETQPCTGKGWKRDNMAAGQSAPARQGREVHCGLRQENDLGQCLVVTILSLHQGRARSGLQEASCVFQSFSFIKVRDLENGSAPQREVGQVNTTWTQARAGHGQHNSSAVVLSFLACPNSTTTTGT